MLVPWLILREEQRAWPARLGVLQLSGMLLALVGFAVYAWTASDFVRVGGGTPAPIFSARRLVTNGLYRYVRNPMYLGVLTAIIGETTFFQSWRLLAFAGIFWLIVHLFVIFYEEPALQRSFGSAYTEYCRRVRRWIPSSRTFLPC